jgi:hypothetical protein
MKIFLTLIMLPSLVWADVRFLTTASDKAPMLARGGTFAGVADDVYAQEGNPAAFDHGQAGRLKDWRFYFNPVLPVALLYDKGVLGNEPRYMVNRNDFAAALALLLSAFRGVSYESNPMFIKLRVLEEQQLAKLRFPTQRMASGIGIFENNSNTLLFRLQLASSVSLGVTGSFYRLEDPAGRQRQGGGISYGILLKPTRKFSIGLVYFNLPDQFPALREPLERIGDETINAGFAYRFADNARAVLDVRNLTDDLSIAPREFHLGLEGTCFNLLELKTGYYFQRGEGGSVLSAGIGLKHGSARFLPRGEIGAFDYAFLYNTAADQAWHALTFNYKL